MAGSRTTGVFGGAVTLPPVLASLGASFTAVAAMLLVAGVLLVTPSVTLKVTVRGVTGLSLEFV